MTTSRALEREAIRAAAERLLAGQPTHSSGALTVVQLAAEAGVKRWLLTHKHPDLREEFEKAREAVNGIPAAFQNLHARAADLEATNLRLRQEKAELTEKVEVYAHVIHALRAEIEELRRARQLPDNVHHLPTRNTPR